jgi:hypothetical protein
MADRTVSVSERDRWAIWVVATAIQPKSFDETRKLNRIWDAFEVETFAAAIVGRTVEQLSTDPVEVKCEEAAFNFLLSQFEPTLGKLAPQAPAKVIASALLELHERLSI